MVAIRIPDTKSVQEMAIRMPDVYCMYNTKKAPQNNASEKLLVCLLSEDEMFVQNNAICYTGKGNRHQKSGVNIAKRSFSCKG
jgi:hypothetical protein